jgi:hypothetical protein
MSIYIYSLTPSHLGHAGVYSSSYLIASWLAGEGEGEGEGEEEQEGQEGQEERRGRGRGRGGETGNGQAIERVFMSVGLISIDLMSIGLISVNLSASCVGRLVGFLSAVVRR